MRHRPLRPSSSGHILQPLRWHASLPFVVLIWALSGMQTALATEEPAARILMVATSHDRLGATGTPTGAYASEIAHPVLAFIAAGHAVDLVSPKGGKTPLVGHAHADAETRAFLDDPAQQLWLANAKTPAEVDPTAYAAIVIAGGHGAMWDLPDDAGIQALITTIDARGGIVAAVCHGPAALVHTRRSDGRLLVAGRRIAAFTDDEENEIGLAEVVPFLLASTLVAQGAIHVPAANWAEQVIRDGNLITGQNPASARRLGREVVAALAEGR